MRLRHFARDLLLAFASIAPLAAALADRPNILFLFADDQAHDTIRALGKLDVDPPNLDRLVAGGTTFTHCYNMSGPMGQAIRYSA